MPNSLTVGSPLRTKLPNTSTMIIGAAVITHPLVTRPETTERLVPSPASACSLIWLTKNTSTSIESPKPSHTPDAHRRSPSRPQP